MKTSIPILTAVAFVVILGWVLFQISPRIISNIIETFPTTATIESPPNVERAATPMPPGDGASSGENMRSTTTPISPTEESVKDEILTVLCANQTDQGANLPTSDVTYLLERYQTNPTLPDLVRSSLFVSPDLHQGCIDASPSRDIIVRTDSQQHQNGINEVTFRLEQDVRARGPFQEVWLIGAASDTYGININDKKESIIGEVIARSSSNDILPLGELQLKTNIADWSFREKQNVVTIQPGSDDVFRILLDYDNVGLDASRAAQLFATKFSLPDSTDDYTINEITIFDTSKLAGVDIVALVLIPKGSNPLIAQAPSKNIASSLICLSSESSRSMDLFEIVEKESIESYRIKESGCNNPGVEQDGGFKIRELAPEVQFLFNKVLDSRTAGSPSSNSVGGADTSKLLIETTDVINATDVYLVMAFRNFCKENTVIPENEKIGKITVSYAGTATNPGLKVSENLIAGANVRQGRSNIKTCGKDGANTSFLTMDVNQQSKRLISRTGIPLRAVKNEDTNFDDAEIWLDLFRFTLPPGQGDLSILIEIIQYQDSEPFVMVFAASLVNEIR